MCGIDITIEEINDDGDCHRNNETNCQEPSLNNSSDAGARVDLNSTFDNDSDLLRRRGPHSFQQVILNPNNLELPTCTLTADRIDKNDTTRSSEATIVAKQRQKIQIRIQSSVLHLRGNQMTVQPVPLQVSSSSCSYFCWNGEAYQMLMEQDDNELEEGSIQESSSSMQENLLQEISYRDESDTMLLGNLLKKVLREALSNSDSSNTCSSNSEEGEIEIDGSTIRYETTVPFLSPSPTTTASASQEPPLSPSSSTTKMLTSIASVFGRVWNGEYAFSLITPKALYYGKDIWGRRSLLVSSNNDIDEGDDNTNKNFWKLTSVTSNEMKEQEQILSELPPGRIYQLDFATGIIQSIAIPTFVIPLARSPVTAFSPLPDNVSESMWKASYTLQELLTQAVKRRVAMTPTTTMLRKIDNYRSNSDHTMDMKSSKVGLLFSGGLDSVVLSALTSEVLSSLSSEQQQQRQQQPIDLINVAFGDVEQSADRKAAWASYHDLQRLYPHQEWRFVCVNVEWEEVEKWETHIRQLLLPKTTTMDLNIGTAIWFASRGHGTCYVAPPTTTSNNANFGPDAIDDQQQIINNYQSTCLVLLLGMGADEQMAGYGRHRNSFRKNGYTGLQKELQMDLGRLWDRNLGRDDRMVSDHGCEARFPYLDTNVTQFLQHALEVHDKCNMELEPGIGDKQVLRLVAHRLGLEACGTLAKRAIQFGSRMAHLSDRKRFGSRRQATGEAQIRDVQQK